VCFSAPSFPLGLKDKGPITFILPLFALAALSILKESKRVLPLSFSLSCSPPLPFL